MTAVVIINVHGASSEVVKWPSITGMVILVSLERNSKVNKTLCWLGKAVRFFNEWLELTFC
jgi:hypothetical protein